MNHWTALAFVGPGKADLVKVPARRPSAGELLIRVLSCGVCTREWHVLRGTLARSFPAVMGHEPVGVVEALGDGVVGFSEGDVVTGVGTSSLAEFDIVTAAHVCKLRCDEPWWRLSLGEPVMCATNAVNRLIASEARMKRVAVVGAGFMGTLVIRTLAAKCAGVQVTAFDTRLGVPAQECSVRVLAPVLDDHEKHEFDVVYECSGAPSSVGFGTALLRNGGTLALFAHHFGIDGAAVNEWHLRGIQVQNTVPWAAPNLGAEVAEAVTLLNRGAVRVDDLIEEVIHMRDAPHFFSEVCSKGSRIRKAAISIAE